MWPQALQMTRDECRGILRRLELESYSHVISVFRAQGGLSDNKAKLLEELRGIFHISQERHRAEARRVANDEQLCTIAEAISGPNTWQEWSREGRRSYPMLPRIAPQTALALIANNVATETAIENANLPYPSDTALAVAAEQANTLSAISGREGVASWELKRENYVVTDDPFKMPDIPAGPKKSLKRNMPESQMINNKKRIVSDNSANKQQQQLQKQFHHITANSSQTASHNTGISNIRKLYHNHNSKTTQQRLTNSPQIPIQKQKLVTKKSALTAGSGAAMPVTSGKRQATPAKSGRKSTTKIQEPKQQQQLPQQTDGRSMPHAVGEGTDELSEQLYAQPQIAASKKDITKNLTKLQLPSVITTPTAVGAVSPTAIAPPSATSIPLTVNALPTRIESHQLATATSSAIAGGFAAIPASLPGKVEKQLISTPVQKIILEDRLPPPLPPVTGSSPSATSSTAVVVSTASTSTPQIMTLPQISAAATKLRAVNTTILPPGTKLATKKLVNSGVGALGNEHITAGGSISNSPVHSQVFNIVDGSSNTNNSQTAPAVPTHTPPAIIQLQSASSVSVSSDGTVSAPLAVPTPHQQPTQGKVLTTKLLPIVLSGGAGGGGSGAGNTVNITKIETLNNGATLVNAASGGSGLSGVGSNNPNTSLGTTIIKNVPSTLLLSPNHSGGAPGGTLFSTLTSGSSVFRKSQIIKAGTIGMSTSSAGKISGTFNASSSGPQIISNIKLTPAISTTSVTSISHSNQQQQSTSQSTFLQHQLKNIPTTGIRTSVKICQSPNGKVFIQPATKAKLQGALAHKLLPNTVVSGAGAGTSTSHQPQRIAIQKVQIIPAPLNSPGNLAGPFHTATTQSHTQVKSTATSNTLTFSGSKGNMNMVFMPTVGARPTSGTITLTKGTSVGGIVSGKVHQQTQNQEAAKPNVVIIGASPAQSGTSAPIKAATFSDGSNKYNANTAISANSGSTLHLDPNQMITEDTPVDILNMPIIVDSGDGTNVTMGNNIGDTVAVLPSSLVESAQQQQQNQQQQPSAIILDATDWEMELDQATAVAAATKAAARSQYRRQSSSNSGHQSDNKQRNSMNDAQKQHQLHDKESIDDGTIIIDDSFEDVIVEEQEEGDIDAGTETEEGEGEMEEGEIDGEETGCEEGLEISEKAYTLVGSNDSCDEILVRKQPDAMKLRVGRVQRIYNNATAMDDDEPIEVIDDDDDDDEVESNNTLNKNVRIGSEKRKLGESAVVANDGGGQSNVATVECDTDAGFDETIVADIDENTAIEFIEEDQHQGDQVECTVEETGMNDITIAPVNATKKQLIDGEVIALDDSDVTAVTATAKLTTAAVASADDTTENAALESNVKKVLSGSASLINISATPAAMATIKSSSTKDIQ